MESNRGRERDGGTCENEYLVIFVVLIVGWFVSLGPGSGQERNKRLEVPHPSSPFWSFTTSHPLRTFLRLPPQFRFKAIPLSLHPQGSPCGSLHPLISPSGHCEPW